MTTAAMDLPEAGMLLARARRQAREAAGLAGSLALHAVAALTVVLLARQEPRPQPEPWTIELVIEQPAAPMPGQAMVEVAVSDRPRPQPPPAATAEIVSALVAIDLPPPDEAPPVNFETPPAPPRRKPATPVAVTPAVGPAPAENVVTGAPATPAVTATAPAPRPLPSPAAAPPVVSRYGAILLAWLERYRDYPRAARLRRQEGEVLLRLTIDRTGRLLGAEIARPSGFDLLDQAALDTVRRAAPLPPVPSDEPAGRLMLLVPVVFALAKG